MKVFDKYFKKDLTKYIKFSYFTSVLLVGLPPVYFIFSIVNIHSIAKLIWLILFILVIFNIKNNLEINLNKAFLILFLIFFLTQSASIVTARNVGAFLERYEDLFFSSIFALVTSAIMEKADDIKILIKILIATAAINVIPQLFIYFFPSLFISFSELFIHKGYLDLIELNIERGRIYLDIYDEILIPVLIFLSINNLKKKEGVFWIILTVLISIFSFISNFRTRFLMAASALAGSLVIFYKNLRKKLLLVLPLLTIFYIIYNLVIQSMGFSVIERVLLEDKAEDVRTVTSRVLRWKKSVEMGISSPLLGVGLGNYYDNLDFSMQRAFSPFESILKEFELASYYPHNIFFRVFAETGFLGLLSIGLLFIYFIKVDSEILVNKNDLAKAFVVAFWTLFLHALFNPSSTVKYQAFFWLLRVVVERVKTMRLKPNIY